MLNGVFMEQEKSLYHFYSLGIVAANKLLSSNNIEVVPVEHASYLDGEVTDNMETSNVGGADSSGQSYQDSVNTTASIKAQWCQEGVGNRVTAPDVRRGDKVIILRYADTDKFYWREWGNSYRRLETVTHAFNANPDESVSTDADNSYYFNVSTHAKEISVHTSDKNGELCQYDIQINTETGYVVIQDNIGNSIELDSAETVIRLKNADNSMLELTKKVINITAPDTVNITAGSGNINLKAGSSVTTKTNTVTVNAESQTNNVPNITNSGNVKTAGKSTTKGFASESGGTFEVSGNGTFTGTVEVDKLISTQDIDAPNVD